MLACLTVQVEDDLSAGEQAVHSQASDSHPIDQHPTTQGAQVGRRMWEGVAAMWRSRWQKQNVHQTAGIRSGQFSEDRDCCVCWESIQTNLRLPCGHLMCLSCMEKMELDHCALRCATGAFDRVKTLQDHGISVTKIEAVLPLDIILKKKRFGPVAHPNCRTSLEVQDLPQFATLEVCPDKACTDFNKEVVNHDYGESLSGDQEFAWDLCKSSRSDCHCGATRHIQQLLFTNCFADVEFCEKFANGMLSQSHLQQDSQGQTTILDMPGHYTMVTVSTRNPSSWVWSG